MQQKDTRDPGHIAYLSNNSEQKLYTVFEICNTKYLDNLVECIS